MITGNRRPGTTTSFIDTANEEVLFKVAADDGGRLLFAYRLYDESGCLVAECDDLKGLPEGLTVTSQGGELLLKIPAPPETRIEYRLYNSNGLLLTCSDGARTQIYGFLRMEGGRL